MTSVLLFGTPFFPQSAPSPVFSDDEYAIPVGGRNPRPFSLSVYLWHNQSGFILPGRLTCPAKSMSFLYILKNKSNRFYVGITSLSVDKRVVRHNRGDVRSTKIGRPWFLIYFEQFDTLRKAREKEKLIKSWKGGNAFRKFLSKTAGSSNGRTWAFEAQYLGSSPSPAVLDGK